MTGWSFIDNIREVKTHNVYAEPLFAATVAAKGNIAVMVEMTVIGELKASSTNKIATKYGNVAGILAYRNARKLLRRFAYDLALLVKDDWGMPKEMQEYFQNPYFFGCFIRNLADEPKSKGWVPPWDVDITAQHARTAAWIAMEPVEYVALRRTLHEVSVCQKVELLKVKNKDGGLIADDFKQRLLSLFQNSE